MYVDIKFANLTDTLEAWPRINNLCGSLTSKIGHTAFVVRLWWIWKNRTSLNYL